MPTNPHTLEAACVPLRTGQAAAEVAARQYNTLSAWPYTGMHNAGPLSDGDLATINEAARWPVEFGPLMVDSACNGNCVQDRFCDCVPDCPKPPRPVMTDSDRMWLGVALGVSAFASLAALTWALPMAWAAVKRWI